MIIFFIPSYNSHLNLEKKSPIALLKILLMKRNQQLALIFMLLLVLGQFMIIPFITPYMIRNVGFTQEQIPFIYFVGGGLTMFSGPLVGKLADKFGRKKVFLIMASFSIIPMFIITNLPSIPIYLALIITGVFFVFISGRMIPSNSLMTSVVLPENRGGFMSLSSSFQQVGAGLASIISGILIYKSSDGLIMNYEWVGYLGIMLTFFAIYISFKLTTLEGK
jgi:predicted MFS family arabinose efflux permease